MNKSSPAASTDSATLKTTMTFSDEQSMLLDTATEFCKSQSPISQVRDLLLSDTGFVPSVWQEMTALGWAGVAVPEEFGGSGLGLAAVVPIVEPMGRHLLGTPYISSQIAVQALLAGGSQEQQNRWLPKLAEGAVASVAVTEADGNWDLRQINTTLTKGELQGSKSLVVDAASSELLIVSVQLGAETALALVPLSDIPAEQLVRETVLDETRRCFTVNLNGVRVSDDDLITGAKADNALRAIQQAAWLLLGADACGGIHATIELVVDYLNTRTQFGRKIGSYQSLKHPTVDMLTGLERARSHLYHCASLFAEGPDATDAGEADIALRMLKADSGDAYNFAADRAIQFHGGFGFTYECDAQLYLRRALWLQYQFGDAPHHRAALQEPLLGALSL